MDVYHLVNVDKQLWTDSPCYELNSLFQLGQGFNSYVELPESTSQMPSHQMNMSQVYDHRMVIHGVECPTGIVQKIRV